MTSINQKPQNPNSWVTLDYKQRKTHNDIPQNHAMWKFLQLYGALYSLPVVNTLNCGYRRFLHSFQLRKLYFDWWFLLIRGRKRIKTFATLVLKHRKTRYDTPRSCMIFFVKIILNLLCLVMTFACKAGYIPPQHSGHSIYIIALACGLKWRRNQIASGVLRAKTVQ